MSLHILFNDYIFATAMRPKWTNITKGETKLIK